ncbi:MULTISPECIES: protease HtpX [unclassified Microbulbifer]|uniref:Protease HtpX n=1 Tax=Microbulbifer spongiae TaxID=2944933 RepID=A0ABY9E745_9GAMM|nr:MULTISPECIES: protease HtpX [unclassified Microbulbifer]MDP5209152.1 protease HtpX [Microbulbifer sp. 2205BS26-8]WKD48849.1 protease HtpX [Microbulbifer sp. MI-G]
MLRIGLFLLTNLAVLVLVGIIFNIFGIGGILQANGVDLNLGALLLLCALFGFGGSFISLFLSKTIARMSTRTQVITEPRSADEQWLVETVRELSRKAGIGMPDVGIFPMPQANAFATGWNRNNALVSVSAGLLQRFGREEARAVIGHEIGHVANGDMVTLALIQGVVNTFVMFFARLVGFFVDRVILRNEQGLGIGYYITSIVMDIVFGFFAMMVVAWFSRRREYRADHAGATLAGPNAMIAALETLKVESERGHEQPLPGNMKAFGIFGNMGALMATHPPLTDRILALQNFRK